MTAVTLPGCGVGGAARIENPLDLFHQARDNMKTVASYRISGDMKVEINGMDGEGVFSVNYDMAIEQKSDGETLAKMYMTF